ncbi:DNA topology modulation protein [Terribacillus sp. DMT04]|uniref:DNA topology modulation protein n=1 Tax=Terribacillus sp. DMT04 TaxID=2850441 RepID=UPI001C2B9E11|nr:DNA topology modulation protein [Terribacillus sp. DMT04]QXE02262.1 DNA topology modulation protein [Terribacillus sp. DMT04]
MNRIAIVGSSGSGKSVLARRLGEMLQVEVWHLDALLWKPDWVLTPREEQKQIQQELVSRDSWIIDGDYNSTLDIRLEAADTIIFLDMPRMICLYRVLKRRLMYHNRSRPDMQKGCKEKLDLALFRRVWQYRTSKRPVVLEKLELLAKDKRVILLNNSKEVKKYVDEMKSQV